MKIANICKSILLKKALDIFLKDYIFVYKNCDFVISDNPMEGEKPLFLISFGDDGDLKIPFTKEALLNKLEIFYKQLAYRTYSKENFIQPNQPSFQSSNANINSKISTTSFASPSFDEMEQKIDNAIENFKFEIKKIMREHYERKQ